MAEPDIDALLAGLEGEEESTEVPPPAKDNSAIKQVRDALKRVEKERDGFRKQVEELSAFKAEAETRQRLTDLTAAGLSPRQSEVFLAAYKDATPENIASFKADVLGQGEAPERTDQGFAPASVQTEVGNKQTYSKSEIANIARQDWARAEELWKAGRVDFTRP